jgi:hypothetical protein
MFVHYGITIGANPIQTPPFPMPVTTLELNRQPFFLLLKIINLAAPLAEAFGFVAFCDILLRLANRYMPGNLK